MKTLSELIAARGINEAHAALLRDRTKVYASTPPGSIPVFGAGVTVHTINADLITLKLARFETLEGDPPNVTPAQYVAAWCRLNHLKA